jgi:uncharacterized membrane protein (DUF373 family)
VRVPSVDWSSKVTIQKGRDVSGHAELDPHHEDPVVRYANRAIRKGVRLLALIMVAVIFLAIIDVGYTIYVKLSAAPEFILDGSGVVAVFGAVLMVLIAVEIYTNVTLYLTSNVIHVQLVLATALMAVARKVIALDYDTIEAGYVFAFAALGLAFGIAYWLVGRGQQSTESRK